MKERLQEIQYKYNKKVERGKKTIRIDVDDYLELKAIAEYILVLHEELEEQ